MFTMVGIACTLAYLALYAVLRLAVSAQPANLIAMAATTVVNTAANRRYTFGVRGAGGAAWHQVQGLVLFGISLSMTAGALDLLQVTDPHAARMTEILTLLAANLVAAMLRFGVMRIWMFRKAPGSGRVRAIRRHPPIHPRRFTPAVPVHRPSVTAAATSTSRRTP